MIDTGLIDLLSCSTWVFWAGHIIHYLSASRFYYLTVGHIIILQLGILLSYSWSYPYLTQVYLAARDGLLGQLRRQMETLAKRVGSDERWRGHH